MPSGGHSLTSIGSGPRRAPPVGCRTDCRRSGGWTWLASTPSRRAMLDAVWIAGDPSTIGHPARPQARACLGLAPHLQESPEGGGEHGYRPPGSRQWPSFPYPAVWEAWSTGPGDHLARKAWAVLRCRPACRTDVEISPPRRPRPRVGPLLECGGVQDGREGHHGAHGWCLPKAPSEGCERCPWQDYLPAPDGSA